MANESEGDNHIPMPNLEELADKSAQRSGNTANYISANQALFHDLTMFISSKFNLLQKEISDLKEEVRKSHQREMLLEKEIDLLKSKSRSDSNSKQDIFLIGSSILREVQPSDLLNGTIKSIPGGKVMDIKKDISTLTTVPKIIITQIGGNDLDCEGNNIDDVVSEYTMVLTQAKEKFPDTKLVVAGLPPRHHTTEIRTKVKDYNDSMKRWCATNGMKFVNNEEMFEFRSGEVDCGSYIMTGATPAVHLTRAATVRMLENLQRSVPELILSDNLHDNKPTYAQAVTSSRRQSNYQIKVPKKMNLYNKDRQGTGRQPTCWYCGITGHTKDSCKYDRPLRCHSCGIQGHKKRYCLSNK